MSQDTLPVRCLGQSGFRFGFPGTTVYVDPYLTDRVAELEGREMGRQVPVAVAPDAVTDADWVLMTHVHLDHCDLATVVPLSRASPRARFLGPWEVCDALIAAGIARDRVVTASEAWSDLGSGLRVRAVPAAHPTIERRPDGLLRHIGFVFEQAGRRIYHSGDTSLADEMIESVRTLMPIDVAFLPVNERNFYREGRGIIGNMTVREAFRFAADLRVRTLVAMHWDMFAPNSVYPEEIELVHRLMRPPFDLALRPERI